MRRLFTWTLTALVAVSVFLFVLAPPAPAPVAVAGWEELAARTVAGAYHVHTTRSDGHGDKNAVAAAAARAGLKFVILTDHGDGTRPPDPPAYVGGVLLIDAVEISTDQGHYVALDLPRAPYPLGGTAAAVVEDVHRLGGFGLAAHPDSPKPTLRWTDTTSPIDGLEWINADSEWRDETGLGLIRAGLVYFLRPPGALALLLDRPSSLDRWNAALKTRPLLTLGGTDAHGGPGRRVEDQGRTLFGTIGIPSYEASFREMSVGAVLDHAPSGTAAEEARAILGAIRSGRVFTAINALATPALLEFTALASGPTVTLSARTAMPRGGTLVVLGPEGEVARGSGSVRAEVPGDRAARYRVEVHTPGAPGRPPVPWLVSNAIDVGPVAPASEASTIASAAPRPGLSPPFPWRIEKDPASQAILRSAATSAELEYTLAPGARRSQFVALASDVGDGTLSAIDLGLRTDRPARVFVQVRSRDHRRWGRSFYVDPMGTQVHARVADLAPMGQGLSPPDATSISSVLLVIDLTNASPGHSGRLQVISSALVK